VSGYNNTGYRFDHLDEAVVNDQGRIDCLHLGLMGRHSVHSSLLEDKDLARSVEHALEYGCPVKVYIEYGVVLSFSTAQVAVTHKIDDEDDTYVIRHRGDAEDGVFYVPKDNSECKKIMALLRHSLEQQRSFCFESTFNVVDTDDGPFGRLEYTAIIFLDEEQGRQPA
jgi:hypothetical protein